ncbi:DUF2306 domain-containing protein [Myceligenerans indicum]|uniref:DUF2306 domain-containing protein n=1 Tax=Myceligenerans indicum TaxID=2593663 RepID=A0ABS1LKJ6_9MICO|nr:DUF2306 domain-containing protein [Myceligenerans indicum]MBL0886732.1 DUF2306 domain-containing protein [Myceligenerans indicum]
MDSLTQPVDTRRRLWIPAVLTLLAVAVAAVAVTPYLTTTLGRLAAEGGGLADAYVDQAPAVRAVFYVHIVTGGLALVLSPVQLWPAIRRRLPALHRWVGRVTLAAITVAGAAGLVLAPFNQAGTVGILGFGILAVLWPGASWLGWAAARRQDLVGHREWMTRAFALTFAAVTLRLWTGVLMAVQVAAAGGDLDAETAFARGYLLVPFLCWVPNLIVAELVIRRTRRA